MKLWKTSAIESKKQINSEPGRNKKYLKTEIKCYRGKSTEKRLSMYLYIRSIN